MNTNLNLSKGSVLLGILVSIGRNKVFLHNKARLTESTKVIIYELYRVIEYEIIFLDSDTEKQTKKRKQRK